MKYFLVFLFVPMMGLSQSKDEKEILSVLGTQTAAWNQGDFDQFMVGYLHTDSLMFIGKSGITYGYAATLSNYKKSYSGADKM
jgi:hypothetical protein